MRIAADERTDHQSRQPRRAGAARRAWLTRRPPSTDTSALVKLVVAEAETNALTQRANDWERIIASEISSIELSRAVKRARADGRADVADDRTVLELLAALDLVPLTEDVRALAATASPPELRTLDAIHLASALTLGTAIDLFVTYDDRLEHAARPAGFTTSRPD